jgi:predicted enzyme related to lactoylglutathione lyase
MLSAGPCYKPIAVSAAKTERHPEQEDRMNFVSMRIITNDVRRLVGFYEDVTGLSATWSTEDFAELVTLFCTLAIGSKRTMDMFGAGAARPADNHTAIIEFRVDDLDKEYDRLKQVISEFVQEPVTQPWGNRSLMFRDPDGNLINFFTPVSAEAIKKHNAQTRPQSE